MTSGTSEPRQVVDDRDCRLSQIRGRLAMHQTEGHRPMSPAQQGERDVAKVALGAAPQAERVICEEYGYRSHSRPAAPSREAGR